MQDDAVIGHPTEPDVSAGESKGKAHSPLAGFVAGVASGWTKLCVGYPFDTLKVSRETTI